MARSAILLGKLGAISVFSFLGLAVSLLAFGLAVGWIPLRSLNIAPDIGPAFAVVVLITMAPLIVMLAALQTLVAGFARSFRETQTYLSLLMLLPMFVSLATAFIETGQALWQYASPLFGQQVVILDMLRGEMPGVAAITLALVGTSLAAAVIHTITDRVYAMERLAISV